MSTSTFLLTCSIMKSPNLRLSYIKHLLSENVLEFEKGHHEKGLMTSWEMWKLIKIDFLDSKFKLLTFLLSWSFFRDIWIFWALNLSCSVFFKRHSFFDIFSRFATAFAYHYTHLCTKLTQKLKIWEFFGLKTFNWNLNHQLWGEKFIRWKN